jgi:sugar-specific transcriptional regulator TrmB
MNFTALKEAGLTEGEIKVYLALLEIGSATSGKIVEKSGVARSIIYQLLEKLAQKGLVSHITKSKTKHYEAAPPQKILEYIEHRREEFEQNKAEVEALLPELLLKQQLSEQNEANFYQGYKGINTAHEKLYKKAKGERNTGISAFLLSSQRTCTSTGSETMSGASRQGSPVASSSMQTRIQQS